MTTKTIVVSLFREPEPSRHTPHKIEAIKIIRSAFGVGLKEAKDLAEDAEKTPILVRATPAQFGMLSALFDIQGDARGGLSAHAVRIDEAWAGLDLTAHEPR